jgi:hypothetical protein
MIIPTNELNEVSDQPAPLQLFGYSQVSEAVNLVDDMLPQELRQFAERLNPDQANRLFDFLIPDVPIPPLDEERKKRFVKFIKQLLDDSEEPDDTAT